MQINVNVTRQHRLETLQNDTGVLISP